MKKLLIGLGGGVVVLIAAALVAPALVPVGAYKRAIIAQVEAASGRTVRIGGSFNLSFLPDIRFDAGKVSLSGAPGGQSGNLATIGKLSAHVALFPLLSGRVAIESIVLEKPVIALAVDRNGRPNWRLGETGAKTAPSAGLPEGANGLTLGNIKLTDGTLSYADARSGERYEADAVNLTLSRPASSGALQMAGSLKWRDQPVSFTLSIDRPAALAAGQPATAAGSLAAAPVKLAFRGTLSDDKRLGGQGVLTVEAPSLRGLAAWLGSPLAAGNGFGAFKLAGNAAIDGADMVLRQAVLSLGSLTAKGELRIDGSRPRPYLQAKLALDRLDLDSYLPPPKTGPTAAAQSSAWSDAPLDLAALRPIDADLDLSLAGLTARKVKLGASHLVVRLKDGKLVADFPQMALYGGKGRATITLDGSASIPAVALDADLSGVQLAPFLADALDVTRLTGTANVRIAASGRGVSQRAIVAALAGKGEIRARNGRIGGVNLAAMVRNVETAFLNPGAGNGNATDFSELGGTFTIRNGILSNSDLELKSPLLQVGGRGTVDLAQRTVDYRIEPRFAAAAAGGLVDLPRVMVPVIVTGSWDDLHYRPDLAAAIGSVTKSGLPKELQRIVPGSVGALPGLSGGATSGPANFLKGLFGH